MKSTDDNSSSSSISSSMSESSLGGLTTLELLWLARGMDHVAKKFQDSGQSEMHPGDFRGMQDLRRRLVETLKASSGGSSQEG